MTMSPGKNVKRSKLLGGVPISDPHVDDVSAQQIIAQMHTPVVPTATGLLEPGSIDEQDASRVRRQALRQASLSQHRSSHTSHRSQVRAWRRCARQAIWDMLAKPISTAHPRAAGRRRYTAQRPTGLVTGHWRGVNSR